MVHAVVMSSTVVSTRVMSLLSTANGDFSPSSSANSRTFHGYSVVIAVSAECRHALPTKSKSQTSTLLSGKAFNPFPSVPPPPMPSDKAAAGATCIPTSSAAPIASATAQRFPAAGTRCRGVACGAGAATAASHAGGGSPKRRWFCRPGRGSGSAFAFALELGWGRSPKSLPPARSPPLGGLWLRARVRRATREAARLREGWSAVALAASAITPATRRGRRMVLIAMGVLPTRCEGSLGWYYYSPFGVRATLRTAPSRVAASTSGFGHG
mmetsp:Transcript_14692/g.44154  ORF Transcript_14692/g.44154 Transcript_14692/m.44154 type:complete len:269 (-) Transcript_14692:224-1030(-)